MQLPPPGQVLAQPPPVSQVQPVQGASGAPAQVPPGAGQQQVLSPPTPLVQPLPQVSGPPAASQGVQQQPGTSSGGGLGQPQPGTSSGGGGLAPPTSAAGRRPSYEPSRTASGETRRPSLNTDDNSQVQLNLTLSPLTKIHEYSLFSD